MGGRHSNFWELRQSLAVIYLNILIHFSIFTVQFIIKGVVIEN